MAGKKQREAERKGKERRKKQRKKKMETTLAQLQLV
jgi:hypothetical protein